MARHMRARQPGARPRLLRPFMRQHCRAAVQAHVMAGAGSAMVKAGARIQLMWTVAAQRPMRQCAMRGGDFSERERCR